MKGRIYMAVPSVFSMPTVAKITSRSSSITNAFVNAIIPTFYPREAEVAEALSILGLDPNDLRCAYCGDPSTEWDHFRPLVQDQRPTGYVSEIANLVPSCGKCNQSKGAQDWHAWMISAAPLSPASRSVPDLESRVARLRDFERWRQPVRVDFGSVVPTEMWTKYWVRHKQLLDEMKQCQESADEIRSLVAGRFEA